MSDEYRKMQERSLRAHVRQRREDEAKKHSTGPDDLGRTVDEGVEMLVGALHALLKGDTGFKMSEGDVEFFEGGTDHSLVVEIRGRRYEIDVHDLGPSSRETMKGVMSHLAGRTEE